MASPQTIEQLLERAGEPAPLTDDQRAVLACALLADPGQTAVFGVTPENVGRIVAERLAVLPAALAALRAGPLEIAGHHEHVRASAAALFRFHLPFARLLAARAREAARRFLVGIAGAPGSGKSVFAALSARLVGALWPAVGVAVVGIDGYHYPDAWLRGHRAPAGVREPGPMKLYKGAHFTFDVARLAADLRRLRQADGPLALPAYDRALHEPVADRIVVRPRHRLVLVEGNYLLHRADGWRAVGDLLDLSVFLNSPPGANREPLLARHQRGGRAREDAIRHYERVDAPNTELALSTRAHAHFVVDLDREHEVRGVRRQ